MTEFLKDPHAMIMVAVYDIMQYEQSFCSYDLTNVNASLKSIFKYSFKTIFFVVKHNESKTDIFVVVNCQSEK